MIVLALALALDPAGADVSDDLRVEVDTDPIIIDDGLAKVQFSVNNTGPEPLFVEFRHSTPSNDSPIRASFTVTAGRVDPGREITTQLKVWRTDTEGGRFDARLTVEVLWGRNTTLVDGDVTLSEVEGSWRHRFDVADALRSDTNPVAFIAVLVGVVTVLGFLMWPLWRERDRNL